MTLVAPENSSRVPRGRTILILPTTRRQVVQRQICRAVGGSLRLDPSATTDDHAHIVERALDAFVLQAGDPAGASAHVSDLLRAIGGEHARRGGSREDLDAAFSAAGSAADRALPIALADIRGPALVHVRRDFAAYVSRLHQCARDGFERACRVLTMTDKQRALALRAALFRTGAERDLPTLVLTAGLAPDLALVALVSTGKPLPPLLLGDPATIAGPTPYEVLVPATWDDAELGHRLRSNQVVAAPAATLDRITESIDLARRGAAVLREGTIGDERTVVPCADLAGSLVVDANPLLADLIIDKRLGALAATGRRRLQLGTFLLAWLQHGVPVARLATMLGVNVQTAHSRMRVIREIFGDQLDDPMARLELIVALPSALSRWRTDDETTTQLQKSL